MPRSLLRQLGAFEPYFKLLESLWSKTPKPLLDKNRVLDVIRKVIRLTDTIFLIDGLDEAKQEYCSAEPLVKLAYERGSYLRIVLSGREPQTIPRCLLRAETLHLESTHARKKIAADIRRYIMSAFPAFYMTSLYIYMAKSKNGSRARLTMCK